MSPSLLRPVADHLWQSTLFAALAGFLALALKNNRAEIRYGLWFAASAKFLVPFSWLIHVGGRFAWRTATELPRATLPSVIARATQPFAASIPLSALPAATPSHTSWLPVTLLILWSIGFAILLYRWTSRLFHMRAAVRSVVAVQLPFPIQARTSEAFLEPGVFGIFQPVLLMPSRILNQLTPPELEALVAHELCHIRRRDNLTGALHLAVEAIFWFHPLVWWIGTRLLEERERACDEDVLRNGYDPQIYAEGILKICALYVARPTPGFAGATGSNLKQRIETIMSNRIAAKLTFAKKLVLTAAAAAALAAPVAVGLWNAPPMQAQVIQPQAPKPDPVATPTAKPAPQVRSKDQPKPAQVLLAQAAQAPVTPSAASNSAAVILVFDRSSSMQGSKMQLARTAAARAISALRSTDTLGLLTFSNNFEWAIAPGKVADHTRTETDQLLAAILPDGGTNIAAALTEAYSQVTTIPATVRHIVLLTDGIAETGTSYDLARAANGNVTISTVGLGPDINWNYLETIARLSGGKSYFVKDPQDLEQILLQDVTEHIAPN